MVAEWRDVPIRNLLMSSDIYTSNNQGESEELNVIDWSNLNLLTVTRIYSWWSDWKLVVADIYNKWEKNNLISQFFNVVLCSIWENNSQQFIHFIPLSLSLPFHLSNIHSNILTDYKEQHKHSVFSCCEQIFCSKQSSAFLIL